MNPDLNISRPLDVHRWSEYPEVNQFVQQVHVACLGSLPNKVSAKHFKVVLLDLYVAWLQNPDLKIAIHRGSNAYTRLHRYNSLHITKKTIDVVDVLLAGGYIGQAKGFYDAETNVGRVSRIWATEKLLTLFKKAQLEPHMVQRAENEEVIILKDEHSKMIDYDETPQTQAMRASIRCYNDLLSNQFIDIRRLNDPWIEKSDGSRLSIGYHSQRVRRVFNRGSFDKGGRFFGAWWEGCPKEWRKEIFINDGPTIEQDYSSLHIALLYARKGVNYYQSNRGDAYQVERPDFLSSDELTRKYCKLLLLMAVNAKSDKATFSAFRNDRREDDDTLGASLKDKQLEILLTRLRARHPLIADSLGSDAGIDLMKVDSEITEYIVKTFTRQGIAVLTIHDSYIVHFAYAQMLQDTLTEAYQRITGLDGIRSAITGVILGDEMSWKTQKLTAEAITRSKGYNQRMIDWMAYRKDREQVLDQKE